MGITWKKGDIIPFGQIKFSVFDENSSSRDEIVDFAEGKVSLYHVQKNIWCPKAKAEVWRLKRMPVETARRRARRWAKSRGYL